MSAWFNLDKSTLPSPADALPGRDEPIVRPGRHTVLGTPTALPFPDGIETACFGLGCFWGAERLFWQADGVYTTAVGYAAGITPNPTYEEVCTGGPATPRSCWSSSTPRKIAYERAAEDLLGEPRPDPGHAPGQRPRHPVPLRDLLRRRGAARRPPRPRATPTRARLADGGHGAITTEILEPAEFYYAEDYHQQYLAKNPGGYCGLGGTGVSCPVGVETA